MIGAILCLAVRLPAQQAVLLELRPRAGDTLRVRVDQEVEMSGTRPSGSVSDSTTTVTTSMRLHTRCVVERADVAGSTILAITDSVWISSTGEHPAEMERARRALLGRSVRLRVAPDGSATPVDDGTTHPPSEFRAIFTQMPATLPRDAVAVGESWTRRLDIPRPGATTSGGTLSATFRLDSLSHGGELAHVSMRGSLSGAPDAARGATRVEMRGAVSGTMTIDRRRGWMTDARTTLAVRSLVTTPGDAKGGPMRVRLKMTQWLRTQ